MHFLTSLSKLYTKVAMFLF